MAVSHNMNQHLVQTKYCHLDNHIVTEDFCGSSQPLRFFAVFSFLHILFDRT